MSADFEAEVSNSMRALQANVDALSRSQDKLEQQVRRFGPEAAASYRKGADAIINVHQHSERLNRQFAHLARGPEAVGRGLIDLGARFGIWGAVAVATVGTVSLAMGKLADKVKEAEGKLAGLGKGEAQSRLELGGVDFGDYADLGEIIDAAHSARGPASQQQINRFVKKLSETGLRLSTAQVTGAIADYAELAPVAGEGESLIQSLQETGSTDRAKGRLSGQLYHLQQAAPRELALAAAQRETEIYGTELGADIGLQETARKLERERRDLAKQGRLLKEGAFSRAGVDNALESLGESLGAAPVVGGLVRLPQVAHDRAQEDHSSALLQEMKTQTRIMETEAAKPTPRLIGEGH